VDRQVFTLADEGQTVLLLCYQSMQTSRRGELAPWPKVAQWIHHVAFESPRFRCRSLRSAWSVLPAAGSRGRIVTRNRNCPLVCFQNALLNLAQLISRARSPACSRLNDGTPPLSRRFMNIRLKTCGRAASTAVTFDLFMRSRQQVVLSASETKPMPPCMSFRISPPPRFDSQKMTVWRGPRAGCRPAVSVALSSIPEAIAIGRRWPSRSRRELGS